MRLATLAVLAANALAGKLPYKGMSKKPKTQGKSRTTSTSSFGAHLVPPTIPAQYTFERAPKPAYVQSATNYQPVYQQQPYSRSAQLPQIVNQPVGLSVQLPRGVNRPPTRPVQLSRGVNRPSTRPVRVKVQPSTQRVQFPLIDNQSVARSIRFNVQRTTPPVDQLTPATVQSTTSHVRKPATVQSTTSHLRKLATFAVPQVTALTANQPTLKPSPQVSSRIVPRVARNVVKLIPPPEIMEAPVICTKAAQPKVVEVVNPPNTVKAAANLNKYRFRTKRTPNQCKRQAMGQIRAVSCGPYTVFNNTSDINVCYNHAMVPVLLQSLSISSWQSINLCGKECKNAEFDCEVLLTGTKEREMASNGCERSGCNSGACNVSGSCTGSSGASASDAFSLPFVSCVEPCCVNGTALLLTFDGGMISGGGAALPATGSGNPVPNSVLYFGMTWESTYIWDVPESLLLDEAHAELLSGTVSFPALITNFSDTLAFSPLSFSSLKSFTLISLYLYPMFSNSDQTVTFEAYSSTSATPSGTKVVNIPAAYQSGAMLVTFPETFANIVSVEIIPVVGVNIGRVTLDNILLCSTFTL